MSSASTLILFCFIGIAVLVEAGNRTMGTGDVSIEAVGRSGKMKLKRAKAKDDMVILFDEIEEVDSNGDPVGNKHFFRNFANTDFNFSDISSADQYGLTAKSFDFNSVMDIKGKISKLKVSTILFRKDGRNVITSDSGETFEVGKGALKFNIEITDWPFCVKGVDKCTKNGSFLDFAIEMKGKGDKPKNGTKKRGGAGKKSRRPPKTQDFENAVGTFSTMCKIDGIWQNMTDGYPKIVTVGKKTTFTFRFPKGATFFYDPVLELTTSEDPPKSGGAVVITVGYYILWISLLVTVVMSMYL